MSKQLYQVKFMNPQTKEIVYGIVDNYPDLPGHKKPPKGVFYIDDALYPRCHIAPESALTEIPLDCHKFGEDELSKFVHADFQKSLKHATTLPRNKVVAGKIFSIGVADGQAWYLIVKVNKKTCNVEWRGWGGGDRYTDHYFGWERKGVPLADVERYVRANDFWRDKEPMALK
jgi:hypothetical protein